MIEVRKRNSTKANFDTTMAGIYVQLPEELRRIVLWKLVQGELQDVGNWCFEMREMVNMITGRETSDEAEVVADQICKMMGDENFGVCISKKFRHWRIWMRALGFTTNCIRKYWRTVHVFKDHYFDYGCNGSFVPPVMKIVRDGAVIEQRVFWDNEITEMERVKKNVVELEKVIKGFDGEIPQLEELNVVDELN